MTTFLHPELHVPVVATAVHGETKGNYAIITNRGVTSLAYVPGNSTKARCKLCASTFSTAYDGHNAIVAHEKN